jgi:hypothetical protein
MTCGFVSSWPQNSKHAEDAWVPEQVDRSFKAFHPDSPAGAVDVPDRRNGFRVKDEAVTPKNPTQVKRLCSQKYDGRANPVGKGRKTGQSDRQSPDLRISRFSVPFVSTQHCLQHGLKISPGHYFHGGNTGSNPVGDANKLRNLRTIAYFSFFIGTKRHSPDPSWAAFVRDHEPSSRSCAGLSQAQKGTIWRGE